MKMNDHTFINEKRKIESKCNLFLLPIILFYYEILFNLLLLRTLFSRRLIFILLFSASFGWILTLLSSISRSARVNRGIRLAMIFLLSLPYIIEYFVHKQFKIFYDLNTVTAGAGDVMGGFLGEIKNLVLCPSGIFCLLLFLLPTILYIALLRRFDSGLQLILRQVRDLLIFTAVSYALSLVLVMTSSVYRADYGKQYNFQEAVSDFGLATALRKDVQRAITGNNSATFEATEPAQPVSSEIAVAEEITYDLNELDLDYEALASTTSGIWADLDRYVSTLTPSSQNEYTGMFEGKNLIFLTGEAFSAEVISPELTPTLYRLATKGINFTDYYQPASAGTTGGEYENIFGMLPTSGGSSLKMTADYNNYFTIGNQLNRLGYYGYAFHNNDYTYYTRNLTHVNLGYSQGFMGYGNGMEAYVTDQWPQSDLEMMEGTLPLYIEHQPFNAYYMTVSGHSGYSQSGNSMSKKNWDAVAELPYSEPVKAYLAANLELENALTYLVNALEEAGIADDTVIVISADHFPYGLDDDAALGNMPYLAELYGYQPQNSFELCHNRLIIWSGCLEDEEPIVVDTPVSSLDILPTLSNLFGTEFDSRLMPGRDVFSDATPLVFDISYNWKTDLGTYVSGTFTPVSADTEIPDGYIDTMNQIVTNKMNYCSSVLNSDYFSHIAAALGE